MVYISGRIRDVFPQIPEPRSELFYLESRIHSKKVTDHKSGSASKNVSGVWTAKITNLKIKLYQWNQFTFSHKVSQQSVKAQDLHLETAVFRLGT
jgi:hypothetical protein